jgi:hypothetical protein
MKHFCGQACVRATLVTECVAAVGPLVHWHSSHSLPALPIMGIALVKGQWSGLFGLSVHRGSSSNPNLLYASPLRGE